MLVTPKSSPGHTPVFPQPTQSTNSNNHNTDQIRHTATQQNTIWINSHSTSLQMGQPHLQSNTNYTSNNNNTGSSTNTHSSQQMNKIMLLMREQIQIANKFYCDKIKLLIQEQAKEICTFRDRLHQNQRELAKKNQIIQQLRLQRQSTPNKRKLSIFSQQQDQSQLTTSVKPDQNAQLHDKIAQLTSRLQVLQGSIAEKHEQQKQMNRKIDSFEKSTIKLMSAKLASCTNKLDQYLIKKQRQIQKIYGDLSMLTKQNKDQHIVNTEHTNIQLHKTISSPLPLSLVQPPPSSSQAQQQPQSSNIASKLVRVQKEIVQLKQEVAQFRSKEYHYDNCMVDKLKQQIVAIKNNISIIQQQQQQQQLDREREKQKNSRSKVEIRMATEGNRIKEFQSQKIIPNNSFRENNSTLMKSQKMTTTAHTLNKSPQPRQPLPQANSYQAPKVLITYGNNNQISQGNQNQRDHHNNLQYHNGANTLLMNHSTPSLHRAASDGERIRGYNQGNQTNTIPAHYTNGNKQGMGPLVKTMTPSHNELNYTTNPRQQNNSHLKAQFFQQAASQQSIQYQQQHSSSCQQYDQNQDQQQQQNQDIQQRLVHTIREQGLSMPLLVEIDQTGCLKCMNNGMYLVDANSDVFYLSEQQMAEFTTKGILRQRNQLTASQRNRIR